MLTGGAFILSGWASAAPAFERVDALASGPLYLSSALEAGKAGAFYGTSHRGGSYDAGTLFKVSSTGAVTVLVNFDRTTTGEEPEHVSVDSAGNLYATTPRGGTYGHGTIVKVTPAGQVTAIPFNLELDSAPASKLVQAADGNLYGTSTRTDTGALVYRMTPAGVITKVATVPYPYGASLGPLTIGADGNFYAIGPSSGLVYQNGTVCRITPAGDVTLFASFGGANGRLPGDELVLAADGNFYGVTQQPPAGTSGTGTIFQLTPQGTLSTVSVLQGANGLQPYLPLRQATDGWLYGTTNSDSATVFRWKPGAAVETVKTFNSDEGWPAGPVVAGKSGMTYGLLGGSNTSDGGVYKLTAKGAFTLVKRIQITNGAAPQSPLTLGSDGTLYGTTLIGGTSNGGTAFRVTKAGKFSKIANFPRTLGWQPYGRLAEGKDGKFYGFLERADGARIYKMSKSGSLSQVAALPYEVQNFPADGLVRDADGNFIGTGALGPFGNSLFKLTPSGTITELAPYSSYVKARLLPDGHGGYLGVKSDYSLQGGGSVFRFTPGSSPTTVGFIDPVTSSAQPYSGVVEGPDGNYYGTTWRDGSHGFGTVYKMTPQGLATRLVDFEGQEGKIPMGQLVSAPDGWLYGTTYMGGAHDYGTVFRISPLGARETVMDFDYTNGAFPSAGLTRGADGNLYGVTSSGGTNAVGQLTGGGQIFRIRLGTEPLASGGPIEVDPNAGPDAFLFTALDGDANNMLTLEEWQQIYVTQPRSETLFAALDVNRDGTLDFPEFKAAATNRTAARTYTAALDRTRLFLEVDTDEDNSLDIPSELAKMWQPGTATATIETWAQRNADGQSALDFLGWLHVKAVPSTTVYAQAKAMRAERAAAAAQLDTDHDGKITRAEFAGLYPADTKATTIDAGWNAVTGTPRGTTPPDWIWLDDFVEAPKLPKL